MTLNDWRHIIEEYTPMVRANVKDFIPEEKAKSIQMNYPMAAEE
jgi:hypothetical protein